MRTKFESASRGKNKKRPKVVVCYFLVGAKGLADAHLGTFAGANRHTAVCLVPAVRTFFLEGSNPTTQSMNKKTVSDDTDFLFMVGWKILAKNPIHNTPIQGLTGNLQ